MKPRSATTGRCGQCGGLPEAHHIVCPSCGTALQPLSEVDLWWCQKCGGGIRDCRCAPSDPQRMERP